jgi:DNA-directed RNA polymerase subunit RPC12/RpoP
LVVLCVIAELFRWKCPNCRSRALELLSTEEIDRWLGQKVVTDNTVNAGGFKTIGDPKLKGVTGGVAVARRTVTVTKRRIRKKLVCNTCGHEFERDVIEEMS